MRLAVITVSVFACMISLPLHAQQKPWSQRIADIALERWPVTQQDALPHAEAVPLLLTAMESLWSNTADGRYFRYVKAAVDAQASQAAAPSLASAYLLAYRVTLDPQYATAATLIVDSSRRMPQASLQAVPGKPSDEEPLDDSSWMAPFLVEYAGIFHRPDLLLDAAAALDVPLARSTNQRLPSADPISYEPTDGTQPTRQRILWSRAEALRSAALAETIRQLPGDAAQSDVWTRLLSSRAVQIARSQDQATGLWFAPGPSSGSPHLDPVVSCLFIYTLAESVRAGNLPSRFSQIALRGYRGVLTRFFSRQQSAATLSNMDRKFAASFMLASAEMEHAPDVPIGRGKTVAMDAWFNSQQRPDVTGQPALFHYKWDDWSDSGYSMAGHLFQSFGATLDTIPVRPTRTGLQGTQVYIIVSPDVPARNPHPHYMEPEDAAAIAAWVKAGGVLMLMENDPKNADLAHLNLLADTFGIHFNPVTRNGVEGDRYEQGTVLIEPGGPIFHQAHRAFMKDTCTITVKQPAHAVLRHKGDTMMAIARYGKGRVFATVDPWIYNEYADGRKLPPAFDNYDAGRELVRWALLQAGMRHAHPSSPGSH